MDKLNEILHELGISKVKLAKFLGVSRQMIYNYLELDDINKWPKDKKVLLLNLLGVKSAEEINTIKIYTDYIMNVETRLSTINDNKLNIEEVKEDDKNFYNGLDKKQQELVANINAIIKEKLDDTNDKESYYIIKYLYHFLMSGIHRE